MYIYIYIHIYIFILYICIYIYKLHKIKVNYVTNRIHGKAFSQTCLHKKNISPLTNYYLHLVPLLDISMIFSCFVGVGVIRS